ncbi:hypothetical protein [Candidatus Poriferisodalis sp.]|uniref:hypothetical protein n=1 Tax=Candidatus Poriferisodalis sp. TaxID=3101277 RepID=UPI003B0146DF
MSTHGEDAQPGDRRRRGHAGAAAAPTADDGADEAIPAGAGTDETRTIRIGSTAAPTALPSVLARAVAFGAIVVAAVCGGLAGYATSALQCSGSCAGPTLSGAAVGALAGAAGVAALAALVLRSMSEWSDQASLRHRGNPSRGRAPRSGPDAAASSSLARRSGATTVRRRP